MDSSLGNAVLDLSADSGPLDGDLNAAHNKVKGFMGGLTSFLGGAMQFAVGGIIQQGLNAVTGSFDSLVKGMIGGNAEFERYNVQFAVLLGSSEAAKKRLAELADFGAKTPFELPQVVKADKILQAFGFHSEESAAKFGFSGEEIRTIAGDVASGTGAEFEAMATYLGKFASGATGETIMRLSELGVLTKSQMAEVGIEFSKSGEMTSPLPEAMNKVLTLMKQKYGGMMDAQSTTFEGMMSNLQDWVGQTLRAIGAPIFEVLKEKLQGLLAFLGSPAVKEGLASIATGIADGLGKILGFFNSIDLSPFISAFTTFTGNLAQGNDVVGSVADLFSELAVAFGMDEDAAYDMGGALMPVIQFFMDLWTTVTGFVTEGAPLLQGLGTILNDVGTIFTAVWGGLVGPILEWVMALIPPLLAVWQQAFMAISTALLNAWTSIQPPLMALITYFQNILPGVLDFLSGVWNNTLMPAITSVGGFIAGTLIPILSQIAVWLLTNIPTAINFLANAWTTVLWPAIQTVIGFFNTVLLPAITQIVAFIGGLLNNAITEDANFWSTTLLPAIQQVGNFINTQLIPFLTILGNFVGSVLVLAVTAFAYVWKATLLPAITSVYQWIQANILPVFQTLGNIISTVIMPILKTLVEDYLKKLWESFQRVGEILKSVTSFFTDLADKISKFKLPDVLQPGSPTPFENGLRGISDAMREVNSIGLPSLAGDAFAGIPSMSAVLTEAFSAGAPSKPVIAQVMLNESVLGEALFEIGGNAFSRERSRVYGAA